MLKKPKFQLLKIYLVSKTFDKFQSKCVENCRTNYTILRQNLSNVVRDTLELQKKPKSKEKLEKRMK